MTTWRGVIVGLLVAATGCGSSKGEGGGGSGPASNAGPVGRAGSAAAATPTAGGKPRLVDPPVLPRPMTRAPAPLVYVLLRKDGAFVVGKIPDAARSDRGIEVAALPDGPALTADQVADAVTVLMPAASTPTPTPAPPASGAMGAAPSSSRCARTPLPTIGTGQIAGRGTPVGDGDGDGALGTTAKHRLGTPASGSDTAVTHAGPGKPGSGTLVSAHNRAMLDDLVAHGQPLRSLDQAADLAPALAPHAVGCPIDADLDAAARLPLFVADRAAPATPLVTLLSRGLVGGLIAVSSDDGDHVRALGFGFGAIDPRATGVAEPPPFFMVALGEADDAVALLQPARGQDVWLKVAPDLTIGRLAAALATAADDGARSVSISVSEVIADEDDAGGANVRLGARDPDAAGDAIPRGDIHRVIQARAGVIKACFEKALAAHPKLAGTVRAHFTIGGDGAVTQASATGLDDAPEVAGCVAHQIEKLRFPAPTSGTVTVNYPFVFSAS